MPAAKAISRSVKARERRRLTVAVYIEINFPFLADPIASPLRPQPHHVDSLQLGVFVPLQVRWLTRLNELYLTVTGIDRDRFVSVRKPRGRLDLRHAISQDLAHPIFLRTESTGVDAILSRLAESDDAQGENRQPDHHFIKRERASPLFISPHNLKSRRAPSARNTLPSIRRPFPDR